MPEDYCELCDLPLSTCVHGNPPAPPPAKAPAARAPRRTSSAPRTRTTAAAPARSLPRRRTPAEDFRPWILRVLDDRAGEAEADEVMEEIGTRMADLLRSGDREKGPTGELRWRTACRTARKQLSDDGLLVAPRPGLWRLTDPGRRAVAD